jgi:hypothetical protein
MMVTIETGTAASNPCHRELAGRKHRAPKKFQPELAHSAKQARWPPCQLRLLEWPRSGAFGATDTFRHEFQEQQSYSGR